MDMDKKIIITIGRQFGSGGGAIGRRVAELLSVAYYDKEIIAAAAGRSGLSEECFEQADEKRPLFSEMISFYYSDANIISPENLFRLQSEAIESIAKESCVIVGRCADYILRGDPATVSCFIHAPMEVKIANIMSHEEGIGEKQVRSMIVKVSRKRARYYNLFTQKRWGDAGSYHLTVDSSVLGTEGTARLIKDFAERKLAGM